MTVVADTRDKSMTTVSITGDKFMTGVSDTGHRICMRKLIKISNSYSPIIRALGEVDSRRRKKAENNMSVYF